MDHNKDIDIDQDIDKDTDKKKDNDKTRTTTKTNFASKIGGKTLCTALPKLRLQFLVVHVHLFG